MNRLFYKVIILSIGIFISNAFGFQQSEAPQTTSPETQVVEPQPVKDEAVTSVNELFEIKDIESFWELTELGGNIRWAIFLIFAAALFLGLKKITELLLDARAGRDLGNVSINEISFEDLQELLKRRKACLIGYLMEKLFEIYYSTGRVEVLQEEIISFRKVQEDTFSRFKNRMSFLGDTAGALGLIGTVWGMFVTFFGGDMDSQHILNGMGIALITTLLGLIVSIIINFASTEIGNYFNKRIEAIVDTVDYLRMRMIGNKEHEMHMALAAAALKYEPNSNAVSKEGMNCKAVSSTDQESVVGLPLIKPLTLQINNVNGIPLEGIDVMFELEGNGGHFPGRKNRFQTVSNKKGEATAHFQLDSNIGERRIQAFVLEKEDDKLTFVVHGTAGPPARVEQIGGNHQSDIIGEALEHPFSMRVYDSFNNPIPKHEVSFVVTKGDGKFGNITESQNGTPTNGLLGRLKSTIVAEKIRYEALTDEDGIAEVNYILGTKPGFNQVTAVAKGLGKMPLIFDAMATPEEERRRGRRRYDD
ncbi:MAG: hypothetical protein DWQ05_12285 [Calditrichaeota bacterium]|nr:MAG: hypothetical protein DWQ05_12285 [Calditrichota bacterium]